MDTLPEILESLKLLAVTRSSLLSPLMSPVVILWGVLPVLKLVCVLKVPSPTPRRTLILLLKRLAVMISVKPSALIRPVVIAWGPEDVPVE